MTSPASVPARTPAAGARSSAALPWLNVLAVLVIVALDWITSAGVVVGILLSIPIVLASLSDDRRQVWLITTLAIAGKLVASLHGMGPISPASVWVPNRVIAFLSLPASAYLALLLQRHRCDAERARDAALSARDLNRLLMSLLAHDLRSPLTLAVQGLDYVGGAARSGQEIDEELVGDLRARLNRSLRAVETVLTVAREGLEGSPAEGARLELTRVGPEIEAEVASFAGEARHLGKTIVTEVGGLEDADPDLRIDVVVLRQALAVLLDNAVRYGVPGEIKVAAEHEGHALVVRVRDRGPGLSSAPLSHGSGLGLELARTLMARVGGRLDVERDDPLGTEFALRLPALGPEPGHRGG